MFQELEPASSVQLREKQRKGKRAHVTHISGFELMKGVGHSEKISKDCFSRVLLWPWDEEMCRHWHRRTRFACTSCLLRKMRKLFDQAHTLQINVGHVIEHECRHWTTVFEARADIVSEGSNFSACTACPVSALS